MSRNCETDYRHLLHGYMVGEDVGLIDFIRFEEAKPFMGFPSMRNTSKATWDQLQLHLEQSGYCLGLK